jgi:glycosyltransferase involved in cell wall biosynthesis
MDSAPRIIREIQALESYFELVLIGNSNQKNGLYIHDLYTFRSFLDKIWSRIDLIFNRKKVRYSKLIPFIRKEKIQLLIIHEPIFFPLAICLKEKYGVKIVFNAHEYHPLEFEDIPGWLSSEGVYYSNLYKQYLHQFDLVINVCESIRNKCIKEFNVDSIVVPNAAFESTTSPSKNNKYPIKLIHHGTLLPGRKIEKMISIVNEAGENYTLDIMGVANMHAMEYYRELEELCSKTSNVRLIPPVDFKEIVPFINRYDIGIYLLEPSNFNNLHALPNKLFEFIQAKLAILVSPTPEMSQLVNKYKIGIVASDFSTSAMVDVLKKITIQEINLYKQNSIIAASTENAEHYQSLFLEQIVSLTKEI